MFFNLPGSADVTFRISVCKISDYRKCGNFVDCSGDKSFCCAGDAVYLAEKIFNLPIRAKYR